MKIHSRLNRSLKQLATLGEGDQSEYEKIKAQKEEYDPVFIQMYRLDAKG